MQRSWVQHSESRKEGLSEQDQSRQECGYQKTGHDSQPASERNGLIMDFPVPGIVHQPKAEADLFPKRQGDKRQGEAGQSGEQIDVEGKRVQALKRKNVEMG